MRLGWYAGVSTALAGSVVLSAFQQRPNFYSAMVYLAQSNLCLLVLVNFILFVYSSVMYSFTRLCFGRLRAVEVEQLTERAWFAITETCLAMTIFREEIGAWFLVMFTTLVTGKVWGWIGDGRVEILEQQPPANPQLFHLRLSVSLVASLIYDIWLLRYITSTVIQQARPNMMVMFLFEFAVLTLCSCRTATRYLLSIAEQRIIKVQTRKRLLERRQEVRQQREEIIRQRELDAASGAEAPGGQEPLPDENDIDEMDIEVPGWAAKGEWVLWLDLITDMLKLGIYVAFFFMLLTFYGLPIHIIRDLFMTSRDFLKRLSALIRYRKAIKEMNKYPDATEEELANENTCIICREEMRPWDPNSLSAVDRIRPKKLPCGHTLHLGCLKSWLERQQVCPTCRRPVTAAERPRPTGNRRVALQIQVGGGAPQEAPRPRPGANANGLDHDMPHNQQPQERGFDQQQDQQAPEPEDRPRVFRLGPMRVGWGANRRQVRELARQFGIPQLNGIQQQAPPAAPTGAQTNPAPTVSGDNLATAAVLLQQAEAALQREYQSLDHRSFSLQTSQLLLTELQNLRLRQQMPQQLPVTQGIGNPVQQNSPFSTSTGQIGNQLHQVPLTPNPFPHPYAGVPARIHSPILGRHGTSSYTTEIPSGSPDLPEGVVIPPGWSLMPLQRLNNQQPQRQPSPQPAATNIDVQIPRPASTSILSINTTDASPTATMAASSTPTLTTRIPRPMQQNGSTRALSPSPLRTSRAASPVSTTTPVISPSPTLPNWGGQAQLLAGNNLTSTPPPPPTLTSPSTNTMTTSPATATPPTLNNNTRAEPTSSSYSTPESSSTNSSEEFKGKGRAATIEEADDDDDV